MASREVFIPPEAFLFNAGFLPQFDFFSPFNFPATPVLPDTNGEEGEDDSTINQSVQDIIDARSALRGAPGGRDPGASLDSAAVRGLPDVSISDAAKGRVAVGLGALAAPALAGPGILGSFALGGLGLAKALGQHFGVVTSGDVGNRPQVGTQAFRDIVGLGEIARAKSLAEQDAIDRAEARAAGQGPARSSIDRSIGGLGGGASGHPGHSRPGKSGGGNKGGSGGGGRSGHPGRDSPGSRGGGSTAGGSGF